MYSLGAFLPTLYTSGAGVIRRGPFCSLGSFVGKCEVHTPSVSETKFLLPVLTAPGLKSSKSHLGDM